MERRVWKKFCPNVLILGLLAFVSLHGNWILGQERINVLPAPASPSTIPVPMIGPLTLDECIQLGYEHQPALAAARASLAAAQTGQASINKLIIPRLFTPDLGVRRQQSCLGVTIAQAGLDQTEWDTRYAITRNFFTIQYVRSQQIVVEEALVNLNKGRKRAEQLRGKGDVDVQITALDMDALDIQIALVKTRKGQVDNGLLKAFAALREAMGVCHDYQLDIIRMELPPPVYAFDKEQLIASALTNRGEMIQANAANRVTELEIDAQGRSRGWKKPTFAMGSDIHAKPIPQGIFNNEYRPGAIGPEMPPMLVGRKNDRVQRAGDLNMRSVAVVDKTNNLVALDVEAQYLKWKEAFEEVQNLLSINKTSQQLPDRVLERSNLNIKEFTGGAIIQANITAVTVRSQLNEAMHIHALALAGLERATAGAFQIYPIPAMINPPAEKK